MPSNTNNSNKAKYWMLTIRHADFTPYLPPGVAYIKGQLEEGSGPGNQEHGTGTEVVGFLHWQVMCIFTNQIRLAGVRKTFGTAHAEPTRSEAAEEYVWKEDTAVEGTRFELGKKPFKRNSETDWNQVLELARAGDLKNREIPADVLIRCYGQLKQIAKDSMKPSAMERQVFVFWGTTGSGKSHRAWEEAGLDAFPKDPMTKFWDGYDGHKHVVIDEYRGGISISHMLRWLDKYPVCIEAKHGGTVFKAEKIWITSNIHPNDWYPDLDVETKAALLRRMTVTHFSMPFQ